MVNGGFPEQTRYGFEKVDVPAPWLLRATPINRKFTPNRIIRIFRDVSPN
jgi:hypothetical protein